MSHQRWLSTLLRRGAIPRPRSYARIAITTCLQMLGAFAALLVLLRVVGSSWEPGVDTAVIVAGVLLVTAYFETDEVIEVAGPSDAVVRAAIERAGFRYRGSSGPVETFRTGWLAAFGRQRVHVIRDGAQSRILVPRYRAEAVKSQLGQSIPEASG